MTGAQAAGRRRATVLYRRHHARRCKRHVRRCRHRGPRCKRLAPLWAGSLIVLSSTPDMARAHHKRHPSRDGRITHRCALSRARRRRKPALRVLSALHNRLDQRVGSALRSKRGLKALSVRMAMGAEARHSVAIRTKSAEALARALDAFINPRSASAGFFYAVACAPRALSSKKSMQVRTARVWWRLGRYSKYMCVPKMLRRYSVKVVSTSPLAILSLTT